MGRPKKEKPSRKDGMYEYKAVVGYAFDGTRIRKSFYSSLSKADAIRKANEYKISQSIAEQTGDIFVADKKTFAEWAMCWLETYKKGNVKEHTYNFTYKSNIEKYLIPYFGRAKLSDIKQADIQRYFNSVRNPITNAPLARSTLEKQKIILTDIFRTAINNDLCIKNPVINIHFLHTAEKKERNVYTRDKAEQVVNYAKQHKNIGVVLLLKTGIRRSELLGLQWGDIDFERNLIHIQRSVVQTKGKIVIGTPKTLTSNRYIPISPELSDYIVQFNQSQEQYIMGSDTPLSPSTFDTRYKKFMKNIEADLNIEPLSPHELRHTYGTLLRESGVDIYTIQKVMGHSDINITSNIYVHNDIEVLRENLRLSVI